MNDDQYKREVGWWMLENNWKQDFRGCSSPGERPPVTREVAGSTPASRAKDTQK